MIPDAWRFILLALVAFRVTRLIGWDDLTITARRRLTGLGDDEHHQWAKWIDHQRQLGNDPWHVPGNPPPSVSEFRFWWSKMLRCPWCIGFWVSGLVAAPGLWHEGWWTIAGWFAMSAVVGLVAKNLDA